MKRCRSSCPSPTHLQGTCKREMAGIYIAPLSKALNIYIAPLSKALNIYIAPLSKALYIYIAPLSTALNIYIAPLSKALHNFCLSNHPFTHQRRLAAMQGTNQLVRRNSGLGVSLRDTDTPRVESNGKPSGFFPQNSYGGQWVKTAN